MRARLMLLSFLIVLSAMTACRGKKRGPYLAPEPERTAATASQ